MAKNSMKPQIRFKGFTDAWEQRKLGDIGRVAMNRRIFKEQTSAEGPVPFYKIGTFGGEPDAFISEELYLEYKEHFPYPKVGDILLSASGSIGKMVEYKGEKAYYQDSNIVWLDHDTSVSNTFLKCFYSVVKWAGLEGSTIKRLYNKNILETQITLPSYAEQVQIGDFFEYIDNLITLHQRKYEKFVNIKKALLEKMFPQGDEKVPRIRFKGFTDAWEQRKLGDVFLYERPDKYIVASDKYSDFYSTPVLTANKGFVLGYTNEKRTYNTPCVIFDDFTLDSKYVDFPFMVKSSALKILTTKQGYYLPFAYELLHAANIEVLGHARHYISVVQPTMVLVPSYSEQLRVGKFIEAIDNLITLHQRQVEKLKNIKAALLEKMFV